MSVFCTYQRPDGRNIVLVQPGRIETGHALHPVVYPMEQSVRHGLRVACPDASANEDFNPELSR